ncbi:MAG: DUF721 domain-containing protein [Synergistaceae bacterium]|nr:DUF721 domain-containing protein [Synergistaceae bacterium]MBQ6971010.1 DUF721 domain-containing protein [Synergistaceae bacterium]
MTEDEGFSFDLRRMFPEAVRRAEILERLKSSWLSVVRKPAIARDSRPVVLGADSLTVEARGEMARSQLTNMKGNITRFLERMGYEAGENFAVRVVDSVRTRRKVSRKKHAPVVVDDGTVREYMSGAPDSLPEDINRAVSHLRAYLEGRNGTLPGNHR